MTENKASSRTTDPPPPPSILAASILPYQRDYFLPLPSIEPAGARAYQSSKPTLPTAAVPDKLPSLDSFQTQAGDYWPGATSSTPVSTAQPLNTLPTPPTDHRDGYKPPGQDRDAPHRGMAAAGAVQQPNMSSTLEPNPPQGLTARRPAANNLPSMELPALPFGNQPPHKPTPINMQAATAQTNIGNLLTPPSTVPGDSVSPNSLSAMMGAGLPTSQGTPSFANYSFLPPPPTGATGTTPLGMGSGTTPGGSWSGLRGLFSPSLFSQLPTNNSGSPLRTEGLPPPPYEIPPPITSFGPGSMSAPPTLPAMSAQQQPLAFMNHNPGPVQAQSQTQTPISAAHPTQPSPVNVADPFMQRPNSTPTTYYQPSQPQSAAQASFPPFNSQPSPISQSPMSAPLMGTRMSPHHAPGPTFSPNASQYGYRAQFPNYPLPAMSAGPASAPLTGALGPMMTNMHNPHNPMIMTGMPSLAMPSGMMQAGYPTNSSQAAAMYGTQQQMPIHDRPFKCDQCPQSFNRNHDLKRHKRIHLAVKPFPCGHCDKSFSRKDALKVRLNSFVYVPSSAEHA